MKYFPLIAGVPVAHLKPNFSVLSELGPQFSFVVSSSSCSGTSGRRAEPPMCRSKVSWTGKAALPVLPRHEGPLISIISFNGGEHIFQDLTEIRCLELHKSVVNVYSNIASWCGTQFFNLPANQSICSMKKDMKRTVMPAVCLVKVRRFCGALEVVLAWNCSETASCAVQTPAVTEERSFPFHMTKANCGRRSLPSPGVIHSMKPLVHPALPSHS